MRRPFLYRKYGEHKKIRENEKRRQLIAKMLASFAGAGILGLALSFGAQSLIEDVIAGLFIIFEKQFQVGDIIQAHGFRGKVTEIGVRTTTLVDVNGDVLIINNSDLRQTINTSANLSPAICDISIAYDEDIERVEKIILANIEDLKNGFPISPKVRSIAAFNRFLIPRWSFACTREPMS